MSFPSWVSACLKSKDLLFFNQLDAKHLDVSAKSDPLVSFRRKPGFYIQSVVCFRRHMKLFQRITSSITSALHLSLVIFKQEQTEMGVPYALSISVIEWKDNSLSYDMDCVFININFRKLPILWLLQCFSLTASSPLITLPSHSVLLRALTKRKVK